MLFSSARQVINDAYSIHDPKGGDPMEGRGTGADKNSQMAHRVEAGKVIAVVDKMKPLHKSICMYFYTSHYTDGDEKRVKNYVTAQFFKHREVHAFFRNYESMVRFLLLVSISSEDAQSLAMTRGLDENNKDSSKHKHNSAQVCIMLNMDPDNYRKRLKPFHDEMVNILRDIEPKVLGPVSKLIAIERDKQTVDV